MGLRDAVVSVATSWPVSWLFSPFLRDQAVIFMFHRFQDTERGVRGHCPETLARGLRHLKEKGFRLVGLDELVRVGREGGDVSRMAAFSVDDGYDDFYRVAAPVFIEEKCPVTVFLITGFLDRGEWQWWDLVRLYLRQTKETRVAYHLGDRTVDLSWSDGGAPAHVRHRIETDITSLGPADRAAVLSELEEGLGVERPGPLTEGVSPLTWDQVAELGEKGVTFGAHTVTHPNCQTLGQEELKEEVSASWRRVREETDATVPVFCFPYGLMPSSKTGARQLLESEGFTGGVSADPEYASRSDILRDPFSLPRFSWPDDHLDLRQVASGFEKAKTVLARRG